MIKRILFNPIATLLASIALVPISDYLGCNRYIFAFACLVCGINMGFAYAAALAHNAEQ